MNVCLRKKTAVITAIILLTNEFPYFMPLYQLNVSLQNFPLRMHTKISGEHLKSLSVKLISNLNFTFLREFVLTLC